MAVKSVNLTAYTNVPFYRDGTLVEPDPNKIQQDPIRVEDTIPVDLTGCILEAGFANEKGQAVFTCSSEIMGSGIEILDPINGAWGWRIPTSKFQGFPGKTLTYDLRIIDNSDNVPRRLWGGAFTVIKGYAGLYPPVP